MEFLSDFEKEDIKDSKYRSKTITYLPYSNVKEEENA